MKEEAIRLLMQSLHQAIGNKRYLHDLEKLLEKLELDSCDAQTLQYLSHDLRDLKSDCDRAERNQFLPPFCR